MLAVRSNVQNLLRTQCLASCYMFEHRHFYKRIKGPSKPVKTVGLGRRKTIVYEQPGIVQPPTAKELFKPMAVEPRREDADNLGEEIVGALSRGSIASILKKFVIDKSVETLAQTNKVTGDLYQQCLESFTKYCLVSKPLSITLHIVFKDIEAGAGHVTDLFPFFLDHAKQVFPHIECMDELRQISNLSDPTTWYPLARSMKRKIVFHVGPTNSGKTYHAMKSFLEAETGVYCGPLRLLAMEVYDKSNAQGVPCDLKTGETRKFANDDDSPSNHMACTVEMLNTNLEYDVAVIDEIQMLGDLQRGWSWTQALLGLAAREVHVCGEETAIDLVEHLAYMCGDSFEVKRYSRLTKLEYLDQELGSLDNVRAGDCIVCFNKRDIYNIMTKLRERNINVSVIYGNQPPGTKINQSRQFNDPNSNCNILVATDAIGMGLNLAIKRIIFYDVNKTTLRHDGMKIRAPLSTSQALQIAGRAGRFKTRFQDGEVTTYFKRDLAQLKRIVSLPRENIEKAGLNATVDMIELFSYHLPNATLSNLLDIFKHVCTVTDHFFMCDVQDIQTLAELLEDVPLNLRSKFTFCVAPLKVREGIPRIMFKMMAKRISEGHSLTYDWLCRALGAPFCMPRNQSELIELEAAFNVIDIYLWLSFRFEMFDDIAQVQDLRVELDTIIQAYMKSLNTGQQGQQPELSYELSQQNPLQAYKFNPKKTGGKQKESNEKNGQTNGWIKSVPNFDSSYTREYLFSDPSSMMDRISKLKQSLDVNDITVPEDIRVDHDISLKHSETVEKDIATDIDVSDSKNMFTETAIEHDISFKHSETAEKDIASYPYLGEKANMFKETANVLDSGESAHLNLSVENKVTNNKSKKFDPILTDEELLAFSENIKWKKQNDSQKASSKVQIQSTKPDASHPKHRSALDKPWKQDAGNQKDISDDSIIVVTSSRQATIEPFRLSTDKSSMKIPASTWPSSASSKQLPEIILEEKEVTNDSEDPIESPSEDTPDVINFWAERPKAPVAKTLDDPLTYIDLVHKETTGTLKDVAYEEINFSAEDSVETLGDLGKEVVNQEDTFDKELEEEIATSLEMQMKRTIYKPVKKVYVPLERIENIDIAKDFENAVKEQEKAHKLGGKMQDTEEVYGKLTRRLLKEKMLSERILKQLETEWEERRKGGQQS